MAFVTADRVKETTSTTGTGTITLAGAASGFRAFSSVLSTGDTCYYSIVFQSGTAWEVGLGTLASSTTLARTTVLSSSNSNGLVSLSGTCDVFITIPAKQAQGALTWQSVQTASFTAAAGNAYPVNTTSSAITVTLPASPSAGNIVQLTDYAGTWGTNNVTVAPNGSNINGGTTSYTLNANRGSIAFVYLDATQGWAVYLAFAMPKTNVYGISYLSVAGGGGGSSEGGGGAGGLLSGTSAAATGTVYSVVIGAGGSGGIISANGGSGTASSITVFASSIGGGGGGKDATNGVAGGSGGGGGNGTTTGGAGTSGQGNSGGNGYYAGGGYYASGGGGGAGAVGGSGTSTAGGSGGNGVITTLITSTQATTYSVGQVSGGNVYFSGGGASGSGTNQGTAGATGLGGGGASGNNANGGAALANTGGGGGGASYGNTGGAGGSGVVIMSVPTFFYSGTYTGTPTVVTNGANTVLIFKSSGSYTA